MLLEEYISELLYDNDCVIIPDFGGFIGNYAPARIDPVKHLFEPPKKKLLFNKGLTQNDGLLAHHVSNSRNIPYSEALNLITNEVTKLKEELKQHKRLALDSIGLLYLDEKGILLFQPDDKVNYLPEAFGLSAFYRLPVTAEEKETKVAEEGKVVPLHRPARRIRTIAAAAAIGAVIASTFWLSFNQDKLSIAYSNLNIFAKKEVAQYSVIKRDALPPMPNIRDSAAASIARILTVPTPVSDNSTNTVATAGNYIIIAGCFRIAENAQNFIKSLKEKNASVFVAGKNPEGLIMVGYGGYKTRDEAEAQLTEFRKNYIAEAWVSEKPRS